MSETKTEARQKVEIAVAAIQTAANCIRSEKETIAAFLKEVRDMDNFGHVLDPTLWKNSERRSVSAMLEPIFKSADQFLAEFDFHTNAARAALARAKGGS